MRVNLICGTDLTGDNLPRLTCGLLAGQFERSDDIILTRENAAIAHIVGAWSPSAVTIARRMTRQTIPFVHTPLASLAPWNKPSATRLRLSDEASAVVASGKMEERLLGKRNTGRLRLIPNAVTTNTITAPEMASQYAELYKSVAETNDNALRETIETKLKLLNEADANIVDVCRELLYAQCLYRQRNIPETFLRSLSALLTASDFDEDRFADVLGLIGLDDFTARIEYVMAERAGLTEGFMPVPAVDDKEAKEMLRIITDY
ncbi:MAG: hypothetical protein LUC22_05300 [Prevotella sp.]|nr:hypothetical protein [Prevotella sp.]